MTSPRPCCVAVLAALQGTGAKSAQCKCGRVVQIVSDKRDMRADLSKAKTLRR